MPPVKRDNEQCGVSKSIVYCIEGLYGRGTCGPKRKHSLFKRAIIHKEVTNLYGKQTISIHIKVATDVLTSCCCGNI